jgi:16S rRNA (adenine1518-N6/adenine1519-N6)-dimethyltransferase
MKKPKLGQHFLTRPKIASWVADSVSILNESTVLEIGPGHGILTKKLLKRASVVVAVEKDKKLVEELKNLFKKEVEKEKLILINEDIRNFKLENYKYFEKDYRLVANIPYYITGYIIRKFLTAKKQPKEIAVLIQKEVAKRIVTKDNKHSILSLSVHAYGTPKLEKTVKAGAFSPPPKVDSAILSIKNISRDNFKSKKHEEMFFKIIKTAFSQKRKTVWSTLKKTLKNKDALTQCDIKINDRPEDISVNKWILLSKNNQI